jgi:tetratricopeptide (TPR) repeat protein
LELAFWGGSRNIAPLYMETDVMQSASFYKLWAWFEVNKKQVGMGAAAVVVVGLAVWFFIWQKNETEVSASEALANISLPQLMNPGQRSEGSEAYLKLAEKYPKSTAGIRALLLSASGLFVEGKYSDAKSRFEKFAHEHPESPFLAQALLGIAACLDAEGKTAEAITAYKSLAEHHRGENVVPQAKFALGRLYESQDKFEDARKEFEEVARGDAYGSLGSEAGMRLEELRIKHPSAFPAPPVPTNALPLTSVMPLSNAVPVNTVPVSNAVPASNTPPVQPERP